LTLGSPSAKAEDVAKSPPDDNRLRELITEHRGSLSAIAAALTQAGQPISRQAVTQWVKRAGMEDDAAVERAKAGLPGPRPQLVDGSVDAVAERAAIAGGVELHGSLRAAAANLGMSRRALFRRRKALGVVSAPRGRRRRRAH
jgi:DNA-binding NtrC family response regulator